jgi:plastocyanin
MRARGITVGLMLAAVAGAAACSSGSSATAPTGSGGGGGGGGGAAGGAGGSANESSTITASSATTGGGAYGAGGNYFFSPTPDTVAAGTSVTFTFGSVTHNVHFEVANAPDSIPASSNTSIARTFMTAGTYPYHCTIHNFSGVLVVQ